MSRLNVKCVFFDMIADVMLQKITLQTKINLTFKSQSLSPVTEGTYESILL